jgi:hypothetical protein
VEVLTVRKAVLVVVTLAVAAGVGLASNSNSGFGPEGLDELEKHKGGPFKTALIHPDADFARYNKLYPQRVLLQFRGPGAAQAESTAGSMVRKKSRPVEIPEGEDLETFRQVISDAFASQMGSCELFEVVQEPGPETFLVRVMVADIVTDVASRSPNSSKPFSARGNIIIDVVDAESGLIQARFSESMKSKKVKNPSQMPDAGMQWVNIWNWAEQAAAEFCQELERVRGEG